MGRKSLSTRSAVIAEIEKAYAELLDGSDWDMDDRQFWDVRLKLLSAALSAADDSDISTRLQAIQERLDDFEKSKQAASVTPLRARTAG